MADIFLKTCSFCLFDLISEVIYFCGGCSLLGMMFSTVKNVKYSRDIISIMGDTLSVHLRVLSTLEGVLYCAEIQLL